MARVRGGINDVARQRYRLVGRLPVARVVFKEEKKGKLRVILVMRANFMVDITTAYSAVSDAEAESCENQ